MRTMVEGGGYHSTPTQKQKHKRKICLEVPLTRNCFADSEGQLGKKEDLKPTS